MAEKDKKLIKRTVPKSKDDLILDAISAIGDRLTNLEDSQKPQTATDLVARHTGEPVEKEPVKVETEPEMKISPKHRAIVDEVLGKQFYAWEDYEATDSTHFLFNIQVPKELSSLPKDDLEKGKVMDVRSKAVANAAGENGVREWCQLVRKNLNNYYAQNAIRSPFVTPGL